MNEIEKILEKGESVTWEEQPQFWPFVLGRVTMYWLLFVLIIILSLAFVLTPEKTTLLVWFYLAGLAAIPIGVFLYSMLARKFTHYAITNKRVIVQRGVIGRDFASFPNSRITNVTVIVGVLDKICMGNSGTVIVQTIGQGVLEHITGPYEVLKLIKKNPL